MQQISLKKSVNILFLLFLIFSGLYFARPFLVPLTLAAIVSMLLLPLSRYLERRGLNNVVAALISVSGILLVMAGLVSLLAWQLSDIVSDFTQIQQKIGELSEQLKSFLSTKLGISAEEQKKILESQAPSGSKGISVVAAVAGMGVDFVLVLVYIFIFLYFRGHLKKFVLRLVPVERMPKTEGIIHDASKVAHKYLSGLALMIAGLWIMYGIGFSIVGIENAFFFAILCGILEIVPFVGNLTGTVITAFMAASQGGSTMVFGVIATYFIVQFIQSYILEPLVVGSEVNINPLFTIIGLVAGEMLWGIAGLILAIPLLGITKIICDNVEPLKPYGFLIGGGEKKKENPLKKKIKDWILKFKGQG